MFFFENQLLCLSASSIACVNFGFLDLFSFEKNDSKSSPKLDK
tara:strand:- start:1547 stop:1675 length:129 start_codon:yes stop_codon:yes gene_type:complete